MNQKKQAENMPVKTPSGSGEKSKFLRKAILLAAIFIVVQLLIQVGVINAYYQIMLITICINIIAAVSLNLITGFTGQFSLGHAGFMAIGAYVCGMLSMHFNSLLGFFIGIFAGGILAAIVGCIIGIPTLRLKGDYLAIATLGLAEIVRIILLNLKSTGGAAGLNGIPQYVNWVWAFIFTAGTIVIIANFLNSSHGRACISIREDEIAAESMGINTTKYKVLAFSLGAFFAGIAGALYSSYFFYIKPDQFNFLKSIDVLVIVVLGGMGSISGSIIAAILLAFINTALQSFAAVRMIIYSALLVIIMLVRPQGLMGSKELSLEKILQKRKNASKKGRIQ